MRTICLNSKTILVTGAAGFIGSNLILELFRCVNPINIIGIDNLNEYYDVSLKEYRLKQIEETIKSYPESNWTFIRGNIADRSIIDFVFKNYKPDLVINFAAQAGVRYSITNPDAYIESNLLGFYNLLKLAAIPMIMVIKELNILCMRLQVLFMVQIKRCRILLRIR